MNLFRNLQVQGNPHINTPHDLMLNPFAYSKLTARRRIPSLIDFMGGCEIY